MKIFNLDQIKEKIKSINILPAIEQAFVSYSEGKAVIPPVGELVFQNPPGDVHIKYGYIKDDDYYVIKIASGFYENPKLNLPSSNGLILLFSQKTGETLAILLDEGYLTDLRTAAAGAIAAKYLAPKNIKKIGIVGTGIQARLQLRYLKSIVPCRDIIVWGRSEDKLQNFKNEMQKDFVIQTTQNIEDITSSCSLIVTTTPSSLPLIQVDQIKKGTHITAIGADSPHKQELDPNIFGKADLIVVDSIQQCVERGDTAHAIKNKIISKESLLELGNVISGSSAKRTSDEQITVADLTGLAIQDITMAKVAYV